jgi:hypothetical protein
LIIKLFKKERVETQTLSTSLFLLLNSLKGLGHKIITKSMYNSKMAQMALASLVAILGPQKVFILRAPMTLEMDLPESKSVCPL